MNKEKASPLRVLLWSPGGSGEHYNGPASFTYRMFSSVSANEMELTLVHGCSEQAHYAIFKKQTMLKNLGDSPSLLQRIKFSITGYRWIKKNARQFDVFHGICAYEHSLVPALAAKRYGLKTVIFMASQNSELAANTLMKKYSGIILLRRFLLRKVDSVVGMSKAIIEELLNNGIEESRIEKIPMGVNTVTYSPFLDLSEKKSGREAKGWPDITTVVFSGSLVERKRPDLLIEALGVLSKSDINVHLVMAGPVADRDYFNSMLERASVLGVDEQVSWLGFTNDVQEVYRLSDIFCLPSSSEGMAAALVEAMSSALASLVTKISGSEDLVKDGVNGFFISQKAEDIAKRIEYYVRNPEDLEQHGQQSRRIVLSGYCHQTVREKYFAMYQRLITS